MGNFQNLGFTFPIYLQPRPQSSTLISQTWKQLQKQTDMRMSRTKVSKSQTRFQNGCPAKVLFSGLLTFTLSSVTPMHLVSSCLRGENWKCSALGVAEETEYRMLFHPLKKFLFWKMSVTYFKNQFLQYENSHIFRLYSENKLTKHLRKAKSHQ